MTCLSGTSNICLRCKPKQVGTESAQRMLSAKCAGVIRVFCLLFFCCFFPAEQRSQAESKQRWLKSRLCLLRAMTNAEGSFAEWQMFEPAGGEFSFGAPPPFFFFFSVHRIALMVKWDKQGRVCLVGWHWCRGVLTTLQCERLTHWCKNHRIEESDWRVFLDRSKKKKAKSRVMILFQGWEPDDFLTV